MRARRAGCTVIAARHQQHVDRKRVIAKGLAAMVSKTYLSPPPPLADLAAATKVALFLDFDGTLVAIAPTPDAIEVPPGLARSLAQLAARHDGRLALISGRSPQDLEQHLGKLLIAVAGSHGAARFHADGSPLGDEPEAIGALVTSAAQDGAQALGLKLERKTHGVALHYRTSPELADEAERLANDLKDRFGLVEKRGKCVIELTRPGAEKGGAVRAFMEQPLFEGATPVFIGDDVTDEDGFTACNDLGGFGIAVGERPSENARYHFEGLEQTYEWLGLDE